MRVLLTDSSTGAGQRVATTLTDAGHQVFRCWDGPAGDLPCRQLHGEPCAMEERAGVDAAVVVRDEREGQSSDWGALCAMRAGVPVVLVGADQSDRLASRAAAAVDHAEDLPSALPGVTARALPALEQPAAAEAERLLRLSGIEGTAQIDMQRSGRDLRVVATVPAGTEARTKELIAIQLAGLLRKSDHWSQRVDITTQEAVGASA